MASATFILARYLETDQNFSDTDDKSCQNSPECLLTPEPVEDPYSSSDDIFKGKQTVIYQDKFINNDIIQSSDVAPWEMVHYLHANYETCEPTQSMEDPSVECLVEETFKFIFPKGLPEVYENEYGHCISWKTVASNMCKDFFAINKKYQWFKDHFVVDYTKPEGRTSFFQNEHFWNEWKKNRDDTDLQSSINLAARIHQVMLCILEDEARTNEVIDKNEIQNQTKGMLFELMAYLNIPVLNSGESRLHFNYNLKVPSRSDKQGILKFMVEPDLTLCTQTWPFCKPIPYCTIKVGQPCCSKSPAKKNPSAESHFEQTNSDFEAKQTSPCSHEDYGFKKLFLDETIKRICAVKEHKRKLHRTGKCSYIQVSTLAEANVESEYQTQLNDMIKKNIPFDLSCVCGSFSSFTKLCSQLGLETYGLIVQRAYRELTKEKFCQEFKDIGLFVMNDCVYVSQITQGAKSLYHLAENKLFFESVERGPTIRYAKFCFSFKKPPHRLGLLVFLHHYNVIMKRLHK